MTVSLLCIVCSGILAFLGKILDVVQKDVAESLTAWSVMFYVMAVAMLLLAVIEFVYFFIRIKRRASRKNEITRFNFPAGKGKPQIALNGIYVGGNAKNQGKNASKQAPGKKRIN